MATDSIRDLELAVAKLQGVVENHETDIRQWSAMPAELSVLRDRQDRMMKDLNELASSFREIGQRLDLEAKERASQRESDREQRQKEKKEQEEREEQREREARRNRFLQVTTLVTLVLLFVSTTTAVLQIS